MSENEVVKMRSRLIVFKIPPLPRKGNFFSLPNEIFNIDLCAGEIALYSYLMRMEDRKTFTCYPSFRTIGKAPFADFACLHRLSACIHDFHIIGGGWAAHRAWAQDRKSVV